MNVGKDGTAAGGSRTILLVDDDEELLAALARTLARAGFLVNAVPDAEHALEELQHAAPDLLLTDLRLPGLSGIELIEAVRRMRPSLPVLIQSACIDDRTRADARRLGAIGPIVKPVPRHELLALLVGALQGQFHV